MEKKHIITYFEKYFANEVEELLFADFCLFAQDLQTYLWSRLRFLQFFSVKFAIQQIN